ncbi:substrate-binding domain-containing protein [Pannonibacter sp. Pt2-lr]
MSAAGARLTVLDGGTLPRQVESGNLLVRQLLESVPDVEGIHFLNDAMAAGGLRYLFEAGIDVPGQVSVIGFNGTSHAFSIRTRLTTLDLPRLQLGRDAACCLLQLCRKNSPVPDQEIGLQIVEGNTARPLLPQWEKHRAVADSAS